MRKIVRKTGNEKVVSVRLSKTDLSDFRKLTEDSETTAKDIFRLGLRTSINNKKNPKEVKLLSMIKLLEDENFEYAIRIESNELIINDLYKKVEECRRVDIEKKHNIVKRMKAVHIEFMDDERISLDMRNSLDEFYSLKRDPIGSIAMENGVEYEDSLRFYDEFLEKQYESSELGHIKTTDELI